MKRTQALPRRTHFLQGHHVADERHDVRLALQVVEERLGEKRHQSLSSTMVAPSPPSLGPAGETLATSGCALKNVRTASRRRPVPWPWTTRNLRSSDSRAWSRNLSMRSVA